MKTIKQTIYTILWRGDVVTHSNMEMEKFGAITIGKHEIDLPVVEIPPKEECEKRFKELELKVIENKQRELDAEMRKYNERG